MSYPSIPNLPTRPFPPRFPSQHSPTGPLADIALQVPLSHELPTWLFLDNWKTLFRATYPEPILQFQRICRYKLDSKADIPDPEFMQVCLTTASKRVKHALRFDGLVVEEDPAEYLWIVANKLQFDIPHGAENALAELVEDEKNGLCQFLDVTPQLQHFRDMGLKLAMLSNAWPFPMPQIFNQAEGGLAPSAFDQLIMSYEVGSAKPSQAFYQEALRRCSAAPADCMMVGDNPDLDIRPALGSGLRAVHIDRYGDCHDFVQGVPVVKKLKQLFRTD
ncbi:MAG: HAD family hydrolase [Candidatus Melainabacteria bacterium]|nr:HAD family hydrolase [Candidatus Melainabacteria bacterium]